MVGGWWYDYADDYDPQPFTPVSASGEPASIQGFPYTIKLPDGRTLSAQEAHTREQANVLFLGDTLSLLGGPPADRCSDSNTRWSTATARTACQARNTASG